LGYIYAEQSDLRKRYINNRGANGDLTLIQDESFNALGFYLLDEISFGKYKLLGGLRYDNNKLSVLDYFISNGNDSGFISMNSWNYSLGLNYKINEKSYLFSSLGTSFETPALSELSANPNGGGFNSLIPQKAHNKEIGYRFYTQKNEFEIVLFDINTSNDLVPYEIESSPGRTFYRNAGKTNRTGLELSFSRQTKEYLNTKFTYTYSNFSYGSFQKGDVDLSGKTLPGIPKHMASITTTLVRGGWNASLTSRFQGALFADDTNEVKEQGFFVSNLNVSFQNGKGKVAWIPFFGVNNLWNSIYNDNIRLNAFGGRYYEPAPTRYVFGGVRVKL
jgi:iron complex outermembrane receptor protein